MNDTEIGYPETEVMQCGCCHATHFKNRGACPYCNASIYWQCLVFNQNWDKPNINACELAVKRAYNFEALHNVRQALKVADKETLKKIKAEVLEYVAS